MIISFALALAAQTRAPPVQITPIQPPPIVRTNTPEVTRFSYSDPWLIAVDHTLGGGCFLYLRYERGTELRIGFNRQRGNGYVLVGNPAWSTLEVGKDYRIDMRFDYENPWQADAVGFRFPSGSQIYLSVSFDRAAFLTEFMAKQNLEITYNGRQVALLSLRGSGAAGLELIRCQDAHPQRSDPFGPNQSAPPTGSDPFRPST